MRLSSGQVPVNPEQLEILENLGFRSFLIICHSPELIKILGLFCLVVLYGSPRFILILEILRFRSFPMMHQDPILLGMLGILGFSVF